MKRIAPHLGAMTFVLVLVFSLAFGASAEKRVIILGFDGVDPGIVSTMMEQGELPNLQKLAEQGVFKPLESSSPPQSPTAWSNFATCRTSLNHGIFDFLRRNPKNYAPSPGFGSVKHPELAPDGSLDKPPAFENFRKGDTFWKIASDNGMRVKSLVVPFAYPNEDLCDSCLQICGLDVRDLRGTQSTYFALSEEFAAGEESVAGGMRIGLRFQGGTAKVDVSGIRNPKTRKYVSVPLTLTVDRDNKKLGIEVMGKTVEVDEGGWSEWLEWDFKLTENYSVQAISRFCVMEAGENVRVYMTCLQYHPRAPYIPISSPGQYATELADRYGLYKTVGWAHDTKALQKEDMTEDMFLDDARRTMAWRETLALDEIDRGGFDLLVAAWTAMDRVSHLFWRYRDPKHPLYTEEGNKKYGRAVEDTYAAMDTTVGKVMERLGEDDLLMVMSDHGFHSFRHGFSVNTWLVRNGYLTVRGQSDPKTAYNDQKYLINFRTGEPHYDMAQSKAYGLGLGMIFLNMKGREGRGIVAPADAPALLGELKKKLMQVTFPETGEKVFSNVYLNINPKGEAVAEAPDIQLGYAEGFQTAKSSAAGAAPKELFTPNLDKWSGEHASSDKAITPGIFVSNIKIEADPALADLGVTALTYLGTEPPAKLEGKPLL